MEQLWARLGGLWYLAGVQSGIRRPASAPRTALRGLLPFTLPQLSVLASLACLGCAALPPAGPQRALYVDLRKAVDLSEDTGGWVIDRVEIESQAGPALRSVCRVDPVERARLERWLDGQLALGGGSAQALYERSGGDLDAAMDALTYERVRSLLRYGERHAEEDCPFYLHPEPDFAGVEGDADRFVLWLESVGGGAIVLEGGKVALGGGGGGRVFAAHGIGATLTLAIGGELSGNGAFVENSAGARTIETTFTAAVPVVLRVSDIARVYDFELAPVVRLATADDELPPGLRATAGIGLTGSRGAMFMPYVLLWLGYEIHPARGSDPIDHTVHVGTRVGVDLDP